VVAMIEFVPSNFVGKNILFSHVTDKPPYNDAHLLVCCELTKLDIIIIVIVTISLMSVFHACTDLTVSPYHAGCPS